MERTLSSRVLERLGQIHGGETGTAFLMLAYSFLAMASYNAIKPITRGKFIDSLGADNLPYVQLAAGALIGVIMVCYSWLIGRLPRRWSLPIIQAGIVGILVVFWFLFRAGGTWVSVAFYIAALILGILLISQFWTLANLVYDARQAKRLFGFIGSGAPLGGIAGSWVTANYVKKIGMENLLLVSAVLMGLCALIVVAIIMKENLTGQSESLKEEKGVAAPQAFELLRTSKHLQTIALVISFAAIGAAIIEQQLNMAAAATHSKGDAIAGYLAFVQLYTSMAGFLVQILLTSRIHRSLGIGFALLILPVSLGTTGLVMLFIAALWAPALARIFDQSLRYTIDKTTREILFMPLPGDVKIKAKPFVDVTVDRFAKGLGATLLLILIKPWGLHLNWQQLSYASLSMMVLWVLMAVRARRGYLEAFRNSIETREVKSAEIRLAVADLSTIEALVEELSSPDEGRVLYAIEILESLDKRMLVTPLLLRHDSSSVRLRALAVVDGAPPGTALRWLPSVKGLLTDPDPEVRAAALGALANIQSVDVLELVRPGLADPNPRIAMTAAMVLAKQGASEDIATAEKVLQRLGADLRDSAVETRKELAAVLRHIPDPRFRRLLIALLTDSSSEVAQEALHSVRRLGDSDFVFVPALISLLHNPRLRAGARDLLIEYGEGALQVLEHFLRDKEEDPAVRRHIPATIARISTQAAVDVLMQALGETDGELRFMVLAGLETMRRRLPGLNFRREPLESLVLLECDKYMRHAAISRDCFGDQVPDRGRLLARALEEKCTRSVDRIYRLLGLTFPWKDVYAARWSIEGGGRARARALEYMDNLLSGTLRKRVLPILEHFQPGIGAVSGGATSRGNDQVRAVALQQLIRDPDPTISAAAIHFVWESRQRQYQTDFEALLSTRNEGDWWVSEAASWALGAFRLPEDRLSELWVEPMPTVEIVARLGRLPLFASVSANELFRISCAGRQIRPKPGEAIYDDGTIPGDIQFLMQGSVVREFSTGEQENVGAPAPLDFQEVLEGRPLSGTLRATTRCICLSLVLEEMQVLMAESVGLLEGLLRMLCTCLPTAISEPVIHGAEVSLLHGDSRNLDPVGKATLLEALPVFSRLTREEMLALVAISTEREAAAETQIFAEMDPPALHLVVTGSWSLESQDDGIVSAGPGDAVGLYQMLAGIPLIRRARCTKDSKFLCVEREDFLELLRQRPDLQRHILGGLFSGGLLSA